MSSSENGPQDRDMNFAFDALLGAIEDHVCPTTGKLDMKAADPDVAVVYNCLSDLDIPAAVVGAAFVSALESAQRIRTMNPEQLL